MRPLAIALSALLLCAGGLYVGCRSAKVPAGKGDKRITTRVGQLRLPGVWLGPSWRGTTPLLSLAAVPPDKANALIYWDIKRNRRAVELRPNYVNHRPRGWREIPTKFGNGWLHPQRQTIILPMVVGGGVELTAGRGDVRRLLPSLRNAPH